jgi:hypothetical protein
MARSERKQVILSYNHNSINVVKKIFDILKEKNILAWYDEQNVEDKISDRYRFLSKNVLSNDHEMHFSDV